MGQKVESHDAFPNEHVLATSQDLIPWFANYANYLASFVVPSDLTFHQSKKFMHDVKNFFSDESYLYRSCANGIIHHCVHDVEMFSVLEACHSSPMGRHHSGIRTAHKILECGYYLTTIHQDAHDFTKIYDRCQRDGGISKRQEFSLNPILVIELFDVWGIDFMGPSVSS